MSEEEPTPGGIRAFFALFALFSIACICSRFDVILMQTPDIVALCALFAHGPLLFVAGILELRSRKEVDGDEMPAWMRLKDPFIKAGFTFSLTFLCVVSIQELGVEFGPVDPTPPAEWPLGKRAGWYGMFTFGFAGITYMALVGSVVPVLRAIAKPLRGGSLAVSVPVMALLGGGLAALIMWLGSLAPVQAGLDWLTALLDDPKIVVAMILVPLFISQALSKK